MQADQLSCNGTLVPRPFSEICSQYQRQVMVLNSDFHSQLSSLFPPHLVISPNRGSSTYLIHWRKQYCEGRFVRCRLKAVKRKQCVQHLFFHLYINLYKNHKVLSHMCCNTLHRNTVEVMATQILDKINSCKLKSYYL